MGKTIRNGKIIGMASTYISDIRYKITTAELPNTLIVLSKNDKIIGSNTTDSTKGGKVSFDVNSMGEYTITATKNNATLWTRTITVNNIGEFICKSGKLLADYTPDELHTICQGGYFSTMFTYKDKIKIVQSGNIFNNYEFFVSNIYKQIDGSEIVKFRMCSYYSGGSYDINPRYYYLSSSTATSWSSSFSNAGGMKYSIMRQRFMVKDEEIYSQATGIKPDDSSLTDGIKFSEIKYTNGGTSALYSYDETTDTMNILSSWQTVSNNNPQFVKGCFKNVGTLTEDTFNSGNYYTYSNGIYTPSITYSSSTSYYGFYETLQENGIFANAVLTSNYKDYIVKSTMKASVGNAQSFYLSEFSDYCTMPTVEEETGINRNTILMSGNSGSSANAGNIPGESEKDPAYDFSVQATGGNSHWTASASFDGNYDFCSVTNNGYIEISGVYRTSYVRPGFKFS